MVKVQEYINQNYPTKEERKNIKELETAYKNLEGELDLRDFVKLEVINCENN